MDGESRQHRDLADVVAPGHEREGEPGRQPPRPPSGERGREKQRRGQEPQPDRVPARPRHGRRVQRAGVRHVRGKRGRATAKQPHRRRAQCRREREDGEGGVGHRLSRSRTSRRRFRSGSGFRSSERRRGSRRARTFLSKTGHSPRRTDQAPGKRAFPFVDHHFSAMRARIARARDPPLACCFGTTARKSHGRVRGVALPMVSPVWHNGSQLLEKR